MCSDLCAMWQAGGGVLSIHWRRGDFLQHRAGRTERVCSDEFTGAKLPACKTEAVLKTPAELAAVVRQKLAVCHATRWEP